MLGIVMNTSMIYAQGRPFPKGSYRKNRNRIERLIEQNPQIEYFYDLARLEVVKQDWDRAQTIIEHVLELDPTYLEGMLFLAQVLESKGQLDEAKELYLHAIKNHPDRSIVFREYGRFLLSRGNLSSARSYLLKALEINPSDAYAHSLLAELYFLHGHQAQAILHLDLGYHQQELHPFYFPQSARILMAMGCYEQAARHWKQAVQLEPKNQMYRSQLRKTLKAKQKSFNQKMKNVFGKK